LAQGSQHRRMSGSDPHKIGRAGGDSRRGTAAGRAILAPTYGVGSRMAFGVSYDRRCAVSCISASVYLTLRKRGADARGDCTFNSGRPNCSWSNRKPLAMLAANCCASGDIGLRWSNSLNTACTRRVISWPYRLSLVWQNLAYKVGNDSRHQSTVCLPSPGIAAART